MMELSLFDLLVVIFNYLLSLFIMRKNSFRRGKRSQKESLHVKKEIIEKSIQQVQELDGHRDFLRSIKCTCLFGRQVAISSGRDMRVRVWDINTKEVIQNLVFSDDVLKAFLIPRDKNGLVACNVGGSQTIIKQIETGETVATILGNLLFTGFIHSLNILVMIIQNSDGSISLLNYDTFSIIKQTENDLSVVTEVVLYENNNHTPKLILSQFQDTENKNFVQVFDLPNMTYVSTLFYGTSENRCRTMSISNDHLATGHFDGHIRVWSISNMCLLWECSGSKQPIGGIAILDCVTPLIISGSWDGSLKVWELATRELKRVSNTNAAICTIAISNNEKSKYLFSGGVNKTISMWELNDIIRDCVWKRRKDYAMFLSSISPSNKGYKWNTETDRIPHALLHVLQVQHLAHEIASYI